MSICKVGWVIKRLPKKANVLKFQTCSHSHLVRWRRHNFLPILIIFRTCTVYLWPYRKDVLSLISGSGPRLHQEQQEKNKKTNDNMLQRPRLTCTCMTKFINISLLNTFPSICLVREIQYTILRPIWVYSREHVPRVYTDTIAKCKEYLVGASHVDLDQIIYYIKAINSENSARKRKQKGRGGSEEVDWFDELACDVLWIGKKIE